jgi:hypothetical protein
MKKERKPNMRMKKKRAVKKSWKKKLPPNVETNTT